jgi:Holliday junction resolvase RusA-like endonuclease
VILKFTVMGIAAPQGSLKAVLRRGTQHPIMLQSNPRTMPWRQEVAACAQRACNEKGGLWPVANAVEFRAIFFLPRPAGHSGKKGLLPSAPKFPSKKPDLSKLVRAAEDAMTGIVYEDDARVVHLRVAKRYADGVAPHAVFEIEVLDG